MKTPLLWKLICEKESIEITEEEYLKYEPKHKDSKSQQKHEADPVLINKKWFIEIAVREFGGINAGDFEDLAGKINEFYNKLEHSTSLSKDKFDCLGHRIASWSKVLTFIDPSKFVIYDSRVAFRLNSIINLKLKENPELKRFCFYIPPYAKDAGGLRSKEVDKLVKKLGSKINPNYQKWKTQHLASDCYSTYLKLIDAIAVLIEKSPNDLCRGDSRIKIKQKIEMTLFATGRIYSSDVNERYIKELGFDPQWETKQCNKFSYERLVDLILEKMEVKN